ncbi:FeoB-associated Cys-rich membrane protein [Flavobacterium magnum]|uniref:FeoB-associated Cys-rich membrane protein n=1 Tax=Flavobacterium magnum TaxID=2162713 RepID=A0A2S0RC62_9FLAO|nr:FeoB-associated Cys-rich membrane protein [Flavobacterium magnum]AWA29205.1 FeoB-associated Cys-rich membrane protein [Flavobacterium magnum]
MDDIQDILAFTTLALAIAFLVRKFLLKKRKPAKNCGSDGCGCH